MATKRLRTDSAEPDALVSHAPPDEVTGELPFPPDAPPIGVNLPAAPPVAAAAIPRVLLAEESLPFRRVIREALTAFRECEVDDTPSGEHAFEMALRREYSLFIFSLPLPDISGDMLDRLIVKAYPLAHRHTHTAPPVIYLMRPADLGTFEQLKRDVRVRGSLSFPPRLDQLLALTAPLLPARQGFTGTGIPAPFPPVFAS